MQHLQLSHVSAASGFPDRARTGHHGRDELITYIEEWPAFGLPSFRSDVSQSTWSAVYRGSPEDTELHRPTRLGPQTAVLAGAAVLTNGIAVLFDTLTVLQSRNQ